MAASRSRQRNSRCLPVSRPKTCRNLHAGAQKCTPTHPAALTAPNPTPQVHTQGTSYDDAEPHHYRPFHASLEDLYGALLQYYDAPWLSLRSVPGPCAPQRLNNAGGGCYGALAGGHRDCRWLASWFCAGALRGGTPPTASSRACSLAPWAGATCTTQITGTPTTSVGDSECKRKPRPATAAGLPAALQLQAPARCAA